MDHTEARVRLLCVYLAAAGLKEYKAEWLKNANTVVRDASGRFASKAANTGAGSTGIVGQFVPEVAGTSVGDSQAGAISRVLRYSPDRREILEGALKRLNEEILIQGSRPKEFIELAFKDPGNALGLNLLKEMSSSLAEDSKQKALSAIRFVEEVAKHPKKTTFEKFEELSAYLTSLTETLNYNKEEYADIAFSAATIAFFAGAGAYLLSPVIAMWPNPWAVLRTVVVGEILKARIQESARSIKEDLDVILGDTKKKTLQKMGKYAEKNGYRVFDDGRKLTSKTPEIVSRRLANPSIYRAGLKVKDKLLNSSGKERAQVLMESMGYSSIDEVEDRIFELVEKNKGLVSPNILNSREVKEFRSLVSLMNQLSAVNFEREKQDNYSKRVLSAENNFGKDLDRILFSESDAELQDAYNGLISKISSPSVEKKKAFTGKFLTGSAAENPLKPDGGMRDFSEKEVDLCDRVSSVFKDMFGERYGDIPIVKYDPQYGSFFLTKERVINLDDILKPASLMYNLVEEELAKQSRIPRSASIDKLAEATLFHEFCHSLEIDSGSASTSASAVRRRADRIRAIFSDRGIRGFTRLMASQLLALHDSYGQVVYTNSLGMPIATEFLTTGAEKLLDPKTLQSALSLDREKVLYALSFAQKTKK